MTPTHLTVDYPGELLASIPSLLGFHPVDSLVVFGLRGARATELTLVLRADLPPPGRAAELARSLLLPLLQQGALGAGLVVIGGRRPDDDDLPHRALVSRCEELFADNGIPIVHQLWVPATSGGCRWFCYDESGCTGVLPDPEDTSLAALAAAAGLPVYGSREDVAATLVPEPDEVLARRSAALDRFSAATEPAGDPDPPDIRLRTVFTAIESAVTRQPDPADDDVIRLVTALTDHRIRDVCLDFAELPDVGAAERLWTALARATPPPERAEPACLLAFSAYARGDGVLAGMALDMAEKADPGHRLTGLLRGALSIGLAPAKLRAAGLRAAVAARKAMVSEP